VAAPSLFPLLSRIETRTLRVPKSTPATIVIGSPAWFVVSSGGGKNTGGSS
jgi:hypothetical protein